MSALSAIVVAEDVDRDIELQEASGRLNAKLHWQALLCASVVVVGIAVRKLKYIELTSIRPLWLNEDIV